MNKPAWTLAGSLALFAAIAADLLLHGPVTAADAGISAWWADHRQPAVTALMLAVTHMHGTVGLLVMSAMLAAWCLARQRWRHVPWLLLVVQGGQVLNVLVKHAFHRARPHWDAPLLQLSTFSFPSGHSSGAAVFWGFVWVLASWWPAPAKVKNTVMIVAPVMVVVTAFSRVYLGAHYLSDVLAGMGEGLAWVCLAVLVKSRWVRQQQSAA